MKTRSGKTNRWAGAIKKMDPDHASWQNKKYDPDRHLNGKGDDTRSYFSTAFKSNFDKIDWSK